jgi:CelD/BcsL family acetyltransferase involved in cellulose biosynthesis
VLQVHAIREAAQDGMLEYRFLRGGEEYKARFADRDATLDTVLSARSRVGRLACRAAARTERHVPHLRRLLQRAAGRR